MVEINPCLTIIGERDLEIADPHIDQGSSAGVRVTARSSPTNDNTPLTLRNAQSLDREPWINSRTI